LCRYIEDGSGALAFASSDGVVRVRTPDFGGSWTPVFRSADARRQEGEHHWTVAVSTVRLYKLDPVDPQLVSTWCQPLRL
jgi:chromosome transmission fidelity protein 4